MAEVHHYDLERILEDLKIAIADSDSVGVQLTELALEAEGEVLDALTAKSIAAPTSTNSRLGNIVNIRTRGKWIQQTDRDGGQKIIDYSDKLLSNWISTQTLIGIASYTTPRRSSPLADE